MIIEEQLNESLLQSSTPQREAHEMTSNRSSHQGAHEMTTNGSSHQGDDVKKGGYFIAKVRTKLMARSFLNKLVHLSSEVLTSFLDPTLYVS